MTGFCLAGMTIAGQSSGWLPEVWSGYLPRSRYPLSIFVVYTHDPQLEQSPSKSAQLTSKLL